MGRRGLGDRHLLPHQLQPDLVLLRRRQKPLCASAGTIGSMSLLCHDRILHERLENPSEVV